MCLAQGPQRSDAGEARTHGPSVSSQASVAHENIQQDKVKFSSKSVADPEGVQGFHLNPPSCPLFLIIL